MMKFLSFLSLFTWLAGSTCAQTDHSAEALRFLRLALPVMLFPYADFELAGQDNIAVGADGSLALGVLDGQDRVNGGLRAELSIDFPFLPGETLSYRWQLLLPPEFTSDVLQNRWMVAGQWHDQPDRARGETWDSFTSHSPPLAIRLGGIGDRVFMAVGYGPTKDGAPQQVSAPRALSRDRWHDIAVTIHWSQGAEGWAILKLDGEPFPIMRGANMNNAAPHYLKLGLYHHPDIRGDRWINLRKVEIGPP